ncbi:hypothetical protein AE04_00290 [Klebsiella aerogenes MGH 78]|uniref:hypothetical protein n=1 Tax=Klebsiella aerogenes TaxID=548 RepID=UPI0004A0CCBE|nr:hypothetical protein [Klebsiella aerogenes]KDF37788.1 hypothetical protein AE04_00290 [Klebsiella aerogenes MGH 78]HDU4537526.1 hypothetical protein [Klebsiella aerogenes]
MTITLQTVNELIASLESAGELSIREQKFLKLAKAFKQLAAENVALKAVFSQGEIPDEAVDAFSDTVAIDSDWDESGTWSYVENEAEVIRAVLDAIKPETPATDRIVAGIKADGVEEFAAYCGEENSVFVEAKAYYRSLPDAAYEFAKQLREGATNEHEQ